MLPAIPNPLVWTWFNWYCRQALRRHFHRVHLYGDAPFDPGRSTLYVATHAGFWDPLVINHLIHARRRQPAYAMAEFKGVQQHPFFRRVGAFTVDRTSPRDGLRAVRHAADLLNRGPNAVLVFPQGGVRSVDERPVRFERGVERILRLAPNSDVVVIALRYEFWTDQRPELLVDLSPGTSRTADGLRAQLTERMDALAAAGRAYRPGDQILLHGRASISDWAQRLPRWR